MNTSVHAVSEGKTTEPAFPDRLEQPKWFKKAIDEPYTSGFVRVEGCDIQYLLWEGKECSSLTDRGLKPTALVFVHGTAAHAHWFHHICPFFAREGYEAVSISMSGFGDSGWRESYGRHIWSKEILTVCRELDLFDEKRKSNPILVGHSLGSFVVEEVAIVCERIKDINLGGIVILDGGVPHPIFWLGKNEAKAFRGNPPKQRVYSNDQLPSERLRLTPLQRIPLPFINEHIANFSAKKLDLNSWTWKFDPAYDTKYSFDRYVREVGIPEQILKLKTRVAVVYGEYSKVVTATDINYMKNQLARHISFVKILNAGHHCFLDYPLQTITALSALFSEWFRSQTACGDGSFLPRLGDRAAESNTMITTEYMKERGGEYVKKLFGRNFQDTPKTDPKSNL